MGILDREITGSGISRVGVSGVNFKDPTKSLVDTIAGMQNRKLEEDRQKLAQANADRTFGLRQRAEERQIAEIARQEKEKAALTHIAKSYRPYDESLGIDNSKLDAQVNSNLGVLTPSETAMVPAVGADGKLLAGQTMPSIDQAVYDRQVAVQNLYEQQRPSQENAQSALIGQALAQGADPKQAASLAESLSIGLTSDATRLKAADQIAKDKTRRDELLFKEQMKTYNKQISSTGKGLTGLAKSLSNINPSQWIGGDRGDAFEEVNEMTTKLKAKKMSDSDINRLMTASLGYASGKTDWWNEDVEFNVSKFKDFVAKGLKNPALYSKSKGYGYGGATPELPQQATRQQELNADAANQDKANAQTLASILGTAPIKQESKIPKSATDSLLGTKPPVGGASAEEIVIPKPPVTMNDTVALIQDSVSSVGTPKPSTVFDDQGYVIVPENNSATNPLELPSTQAAAEMINTSYDTEGGNTFEPTGEVVNGKKVYSIGGDFFTLADEAPGVSEVSEPATIDLSKELSSIKELVSKDTTYNSFGGMLSRGLSFGLSADINEPSFEGRTKVRTARLLKDAGVTTKEQFDKLLPTIEDSSTRAAVKAVYKDSVVRADADIYDAYKKEQDSKQVSDAVDLIVSTIPFPSAKAIIAVRGDRLIAAAKALRKLKNAERSARKTNQAGKLREVLKKKEEIIKKYKLKGSETGAGRNRSELGPEKNLSELRPGRKVNDIKWSKHSGSVDDFVDAAVALAAKKAKKPLTDKQIDKIIKKARKEF